MICFQKKKEIEELAKEKLVLESKEKKVCADLLKTNQEIEDLQRKNQNLATNEAKLNWDLVSVGKEMDEIKKEKILLQSSELKLKNELTEIKVSLEQKINELSLLEKSKKETEGNNSMLINKIIDFETKIKTKDAEIVDLNSEISNLSNLNESLKIEKESISKLCKNHEGIIVVEKNKFDELDSKLKILLEKSMADQNENLKLKGQIKDISLELEKKSKEIVVLTDAKLEVERKVAFLENDLEKYKNILKEDTKTFELSQKMEEISNLGLQIEKLKGQYSLRSVMMDTLQQKFDKNTLELSELNSKYETLEKQSKDDQNVILGLKDSLVKAEMVKKEIEKMLDLEKLEKEKNMGMLVI